MATAVRYNGPSASATIRGSDGALYVCPINQQITVPDDTAIALFAEGWTAPDGSTPGFIPPDSTTIEEVFLANGTLSKRGPSGSTVPVSAVGGGTPAVFARPFVPSSAVVAGQVITQAGQLYTAPGNFTAASSFTVGNWSLGAPLGTVYELNVSGQVVAVWIGTGPGTAATKILDIATSGLWIPGNSWQAGAAYGADTIVNRSGSGYLAVVPSTGIDPATDDGTHWQLVASKGDKGDIGPTGSPTADQAILLRHMADFARDPWLLNGGGAAGTPTGPHIAQSMNRLDPSVNYPLTSGTLHMTAIPVPGGRALSGGSVKHGVAMSGGTHAWLGLWDFTAGTQLALSADDTSASATTTAKRDFTFGAPYTPATGRFVLAGFLQLATTPGSLTGRAQANVAADAPSLAGNHATTALTTPPGSASISTAKSPFWVSLF